VAKWCSLRGQYQYSTRDASDPEYDFNSNMVSIYAHFFFDLYK
jgi:hypothetical protein